MADPSGALPSTRSRGWSKIRGKLQDLSIHKKADRDNAQEIDDFLGKTTSNSSDPSRPESSGSLDPRPLVPRINTIPTAQPEAQPEWATRAEDLADGKWRPTKPLRRSGLVVAFDERPALIGEGGFSEDPPSVIRQVHHGQTSAIETTARTVSSENSAIQRKATRAAGYPSAAARAHETHVLQRRPAPQVEPLSHAQQPRLPNISITSSQSSHLQGASGITSDNQPDLPVPNPKPVASTAQPQLQVTKLPSERLYTDIESSLRTPTSPSAQRIYEMRAEEGMAHRRSIRNASEVLGPKPPRSHSPSSSVSSLDQQAHIMAGIASSDSSRPVSQHSRFASTPEPTAFNDATEFPLGKMSSADYASSHLSLPSSSRGPRHGPPAYQDLATRKRDEVEATLLQDVAPPKYQNVPALNTSNITTPPPVLAPQIASQAMTSATSPEEPPVVVSASSIPSAAAPKPRRPSNRNGLQFVEGQPLAPAPSLPSPIPTDMPSDASPAVETPPLTVQRQQPPAALSGLAPPDAVAPPLQSPPYTASAVAMSHQSLPLAGQSGTRRVLSTRSGASNEDAMMQFSQFANGGYNIFELAAQNEGREHSSVEWQHCALWWFLQGRMGLEDIARDTMPGINATVLAQHHVNLAKALWITENVLPQLLDPTSIDATPGQSVTDAIMNGIANLCGSMRKRNILPHPQYVVSGVDQSIWTARPFDSYPTEWMYVLNGSPFTTGGRAPSHPPLQAFPLGDSRSEYCYGRVSVQATVALRDQETTHKPFDGILTVIRKIDSPELEVVVSSQSTEACINIRTVNDMGVHWEHTYFEHEHHFLLVKLPHKVSVMLHLSPKDYTWLWSCYDNSQKITRSMRPHSDEHLMQTFDLAAFAYRDSAHPDDFPDQRIEHCRLAVFERHFRPEDHAKRVTHRGYRLCVMTTSKLIRNVQFTVGMKAPLQFSTSLSTPDFRMQLKEMDRGRSALLSFDSFEHRDFFVDMITGRMLAPDETIMTSFPLKAVKAGAVKKGVTPEQWSNLKFKELLIIDEEHPDDPQHKLSSCDMSERLRVMMFSNAGTCVDRLCDALMDVRIRLDSDEQTTLQIMRPGPREDLTVGIGPEDGAEGYLRHLFDTVTSVPSAFAYTFNSLDSMHTFERAVTGYKVTYDCVPSAFVITRRQMYVGKDKNWPTRNPRVQIVQRDQRYQLLAFFQDYIVADCLNFEIKRMDTFEQTTGHKSAGHGIHGMKLVDAKFTLPGSNKDDWLREGAERDATAKYTNLAAEEYAAEHDDILIYFDTEEERDRFGDFLPAPVTKARSKFNLMRRI